jgi:hypothetical protein
MDFTSIPAWVKRITILFQGVSTTGTSNLQIQLGTGATPTYATSGYIGARADIFNGSSPSVTAYASAFVLGNAFATTYVLHGSAVIYNISGNLWVESHGISRSDTVMSGTGAGSITLGAALTAIRINTSNGTDTLDAGSVNILYE